MVHIYAHEAFNLITPQLSSTPGSKEGIDIWFVLLGPTNGKIGKRTKLSERQITVNEAYRNLAKITALRNVPLRLQVSKGRQMVSHLKTAWFCWNKNASCFRMHPLEGTPCNWHQHPLIQVLEAGWPECPMGECSGSRTLQDQWPGWDFRWRFWVFAWEYFWAFSCGKDA